jgi:hypothetical protein
MREPNIRNVTIDELMQMTDREGLILRGCGGEPREWLDGINKLLTEAGILLDGDKFTDVSAFEHNGATNLLFDMSNVKLDVGKLALWRLQTRDTFGGVWLSDYRANRLGESQSPELLPECVKPEAALIGADGNVFNILGIARNALNRAKLRDEAKEMTARVMSSDGYDNALAITAEYVEPVEVAEFGEQEMQM